MSLFPLLVHKIFRGAAPFGNKNQTSLMTGKNSITELQCQRKSLEEGYEKIALWGGWLKQRSSSNADPAGWRDCFQGTELRELKVKSSPDTKMHHRNVLCLFHLAFGSKTKWDTGSCNIKPFNVAICRALLALATFFVCVLMNFFLFKHAEDRKINSKLVLLYIALISLWEAVCRSLHSFYVPEL